MFSNETIRKLREIHMGVMAEQLSAQLEDPQFRNVPFEDRLAMLVDAEWSARKSNRLTGLIKKAGYADTQASVENIEYIAERHLDREQILRLASCSYIQEARNVIILGATGAGKTFLACSLGVAANRNFCAARYLRLPNLLVEIAVVRRDGTYREYMKQLKKVKLLILDEWLLYPLKEAEARDLITMGKDGSRAYYKDMIVEAAPFLQENTIETTGAGDTFCASTLNYVLDHGLENLTEENLKELLTFANAAASLITTRKGALRVMPTREEVESFIASRK